MKFNTNLHNPIPLHTSKSLWYCKARHAESAVNYFPVLPLNTIPRFQLTSSDFPTALVRSTSAKITMIQNSGFSASQIVYEGTLNGTLNDTGLCIFNGGLVSNESQLGIAFSIIIEPHELLQDSYYISVNGHYVKQLTHNVLEKYVFSKVTIESGFSDATYKLYNGNIEIGQLNSLSAINLSYTGSNTRSYTINICRYCDDAVVHTLTNSAKFTIVPPQFMSENIKSYVAIGGDSVISAQTTVGTYYVELIMDAQTWYSEPFTWADNMYDYIQVRYRRTSPIITADNYIAFVDQQGNDIYAVMYLPTTLLAPPYQFEPTIEENDGYKFIQKLVSYRSEKMEFFCTGYFAEAIRILWHCNVRTISQQPEQQRIVDYMEAPEINWDNDTHYCSVVITFNTDTIIQTNGNVEVDVTGIIVNHQSFDNSFDNSYN